LWDKGSQGFSPDAGRFVLHVAPRASGLLHSDVSASRAGPDSGLRATASRRLFVEAHLPTEQPQARQDPRLPPPHAYQGRPRGAARPPVTWAEASLGLIRRVRDRATFAALARAHRRRAGPVSLRFLSDGSDEPARVAYAVGRRFGNAVERNRARRRLRAAIALDEALLLPGGAYLLAAERTVMTIPFPTLREHVTTLLQQTRGDRS
jgi:ribonuclease P protein component